MTFITRDKIEQKLQEFLKSLDIKFVREVASISIINPFDTDIPVCPRCLAVEVRALWPSLQRRESYILNGAIAVDSDGLIKDASFRVIDYTKFPNRTTYGPNFEMYVRKGIGVYNCIKQTDKNGNITLEDGYKE